MKAGVIKGLILDPSIQIQPTLGPWAPKSANMTYVGLLGSLGFKHVEQSFARASKP